MSDDLPTLAEIERQFDGAVDKLRQEHAIATARDDMYGTEANIRDLIHAVDDFLHEYLIISSLLRAWHNDDIPF